MMRPMYADPGLAVSPSTKTSHPDAPTAPRTADTGAVTATTSAQAAAQTAPMSSPVDSYIASLMRAPSGLAGNLGPLPVQFQNPVGINPFLHTPPPLSGGQMFLRNLVAGYNARALPATMLGGVTGRGGASGLAEAVRLQQALTGRVDPNNDLKRMLLEAQIKAEGQRGGAAAALGERRLSPDPNADLIRALLGARIGAENALTARRQIPPAGRAAAGGGGAKPVTYASERASILARARQLAAQRDGAVQQIGASQGWTPEQITAGRARMKADVATQAKAALDALDQRYGVQGGGASPAVPAAPDPLGIR